MKAQKEPYVSTTNACKLCKPLGACLAFRGIEGAVPYLHGSQGCATYMRRYIIGHFREPMDIASSSLGEKHAIYGGGPNLKLGLKNVITKYHCGLIGVATTCLTETIGDDVSMLMREFRQEFEELFQDSRGTEIVNVSTPSYGGTHMEGFHAAVKAAVDQLSISEPKHEGINLFPGFVSPEDIRYVQGVLDDFGLAGTILPDISLSLDGPAVSYYEKLPSGGTPISAIKSMGGSSATIEFGRTLPQGLSAGTLLENRFSVPLHSIGLPIGLRETDRFFETLESVSGRPTPEKHLLERGRLIDALVDAHKYVFGKKVVVYGEEDLVVGLTSLLAEMGAHPIMCASGGRTGHLVEAVKAVTDDVLSDPPVVKEGVDFHEIAVEAEAMNPELLLENSKGYHLARRWDAPLVRVGFPIHDRFGGQRVVHVGYRGALSLLDTIANTVIEGKQYSSKIGYTYY